MIRHDEPDAPAECRLEVVGRGHRRPRLRGDALGLARDLDRILDWLRGNLAGDRILERLESVYVLMGSPICIFRVLIGAEHSGLESFCAAEGGYLLENGEAPRAVTHEQPAAISPRLWPVRRPAVLARSGTPPVRDIRARPRQAGHNSVGERLAARPPPGRGRPPGSWPRFRGSTSPSSGRAVRRDRRPSSPQEPPPPGPREAQDRDWPRARDHPDRRRGRRGQPAHRQPLPGGRLHARVAAPDLAGPELLRLRVGRLAPRRRAVEAEPRAGAARPDVALAGEGDGGDRGPPLLPARRARLRRASRAPRSPTSRPGGPSRAARRSRSSSCATSTSGRPSATLCRKLQEACLATELEDAGRSRPILAAYLNDVFYGAARLRRAGRGADVLLAARRPAHARRRPRCSPGSRRRRRPVTRCRNPRAARRAATPCSPRCSSAGYISPRRYRPRVGRPLQLRPGAATARPAPALLRLRPAQLIARIGSRRSRQAGCACGRRSTRMAGSRPSTRWPGPAARGDRPGRRARRDRPVDGRGPRDGDPPAERAAAPVQPRDAGRPPGGSVVQAVHARDRARGGHLAPAPTATGPPSLTIPDPRCAIERRAVGRPQLRRRGRAAR